jgi:hypothetical protein
VLVFLFWGHTSSPLEGQRVVPAYEQIYLSPCM